MKNENAKSPRDKRRTPSNYEDNNNQENNSNKDDSRKNSFNN